MSRLPISTLKILSIGHLQHIPYFSRNLYKIHMKSSDLGLPNSNLDIYKVEHLINFFYLLLDLGLVDRSPK